MEASRPKLPAAHSVPAQAAPITIWYWPEPQGTHEAEPALLQPFVVALLVHTMLEEPVKPSEHAVGYV